MVIVFITFHHLIIFFSIKILDDVDNFMGRSALQSQPAHCMLFCFAKRAGSVREHNFF